MTADSLASSAGTGPECRRLRILYVIQEMNRGGAERVVVTLARAATSRGHEVALAAHPGPLSPEFAGASFDLPLVGRSVARLPLAALAVDRAIRAWPPDLIHANNPGMALATALATARGRRRPALVSVQGVPPDDYGLTSRILRLAGLPVVACGRQVLRALEATGTAVHATVGNAVGPPPPPRSRGELTREFDIDARAPVVVSVGRLVPQKNHGLAVRALAEVPEAVLIVLGEGPERVTIEETARRHGVADRVRLAGSRSDARSIVGAADVVVSASRWEGLPLAIIEAMAAGRPVVATRVIGLEELIDDGRNGLLVPPGDATAMAAALRRVLEDPVLSARLRTNGSATAEGYSEEGMIDGYLAVYHDIVDGRA